MKAPSFFSDAATTEGGLQIIDLSAEDWLERTCEALVPPFHLPDLDQVPELYQEQIGERGELPFVSILLLAKERLRARSAVVEPYISTDWYEEYSQLYSRVFREIPREASRIHFFASVPGDRLVRYTDFFDMPECFREAYLGYTVMRPLPAFRAGDTVLRSPCTIGRGKHLVHCMAEFHVSLLGNDLTVEGMPFCQQETSVGRCAEADLWMLSRFLNKQGETRRYRPAEITAISRRTFASGPPREGLNEYQMVDALRQMGLNPECINPPSAENARELIYSCIESELPVIAGIPDHVVVIIGHDHVAPLTFDGAFCPAATDFRLGSMSQAVGTFIAHDDEQGPYEDQEVMMGGGEEDEPEHSEGGEEQTKLLRLNEADVDFCLVVMPPRIHLNCFEVWRHSVNWLERVNAVVTDTFDKAEPDLWSEDELDDLILRVYLRRCDRFKSDLLNPRSTPRRHKDFIALYRCLQMPRFVWVVELAYRSELEGTAPDKRRIRGEIVFDSTANRNVPEESLLAFHLSGRMFVPRRGDRDPIFWKRSAEKPYCPLQRTARARRR